jgi:hypothetical protein
MVQDHLVVPKDFELHRKIMDEEHCSTYSIHPGTNKIESASRPLIDFGD